MQIPREIIDRIVNETDIVEVISESVSLKKAGNNYKGLCPFHAENTPSFNVAPGKNLFYCFGCNTGGDVIGFLTKREGLSFVDAVEKLASRLRIPIPRDNADPAVRDEREIFYKINAYASWFFREQYRRHAMVRDYVAGRGITEATADGFEIGYAPDGFDGLTGYLKGKNIPLEKAALLGLIKRHEEKGHYYDFYRHRLIFPIFSPQGHIIGFGGRTLKTGSDEAKYINSPDSPVYHKSRELFALYQHRKEIARSRRVVVVEGYIDAVACAQLGFPVAVAPLGTSLTPEQARLIKRQTDEIILMFDSDEAGRKAALRAFAVCLEAGVHPKIAGLKGGKDAGDLLTDAQGKERLAATLSQATYAMDWVLVKTLNTTGSTPMDKYNSLKFVNSWLDRLPDPVMRLAYGQKVAEQFGVPHRSLYKVIDSSCQSAKVPHFAEPGLSGDELVVLAFMNRPEGLQNIDLVDVAESFADAVLAELAGVLEKFYKNQATFAVKMTISDVPDRLQSVYSRLIAGGEHYGELNSGELLRQNRRLTRQNRLKRITAQIMQAEMSGDTARLNELLSEKQRLSKSDLT